MERGPRAMEDDPIKNWRYETSEDLEKLLEAYRLAYSDDIAIANGTATTWNSWYASLTFRTSKSQRINDVYERGLKLLEELRAQEAAGVSPGVTPGGDARLEVAVGDIDGFVKAATDEVGATVGAGTTVLLDAVKKGGERLGAAVNDMKDPPENLRPTVDDRGGVAPPIAPPVTPPPVTPPPVTTPEPRDAFGMAPRPDVPQGAVDIIKRWEGLELHSYQDAVNIWTIGYGTITYPDGRRVGPGESVTEAEAERYLAHYLEEKVVPKLSSTIPYWSEMNDNQRAALMSFAYNLGEGFYGARNFQTISRELRERDWDAVPAALALYRMAGGRVLTGLVRRRADEGALWRGDGPYAVA